MAWSTSTRKERLPSNWKARRKEIFRLKGDRCLVVDDDGPCLKPATDIDHIKAGDDDSNENLQPICRDHHKAKSSREGWEALRKQKRIARFRAERQFGWQESHPGAGDHEPYKHPWQS